MPDTPTFPPINPSAPYGPVSLLPEFSAYRPGTTLKVTFTSPADVEAGSVQGNSSSHPTTLQTNSGGRLTWKKTQARPCVSFPPEKDHPNATYTILMTDPDAPTPLDTKYAYWRHWIQPGVRPSEYPDAEAKTDKAPLTEYLAPGKKEPSADPHRYLVLLYREPPPGHAYHSLTKEDIGAETFEARRAFDAKAWVAKYELELVAVEWFWGTG